MNTTGLVVYGSIKKQSPDYSNPQRQRITKSFIILIVLVAILLPLNSFAQFGRYRAKAWGSVFSVNRFYGVEKKSRVDIGMVRDQFFEFGGITIFGQSDSWYWAPLGLYLPIHATKWASLGLNSRFYLFPDHEIYSSDPKNPRILDFMVRLDMPLVSIAAGYRYQKGSWKDSFGKVSHQNITGSYVEISYGLSGPASSAKEIYKEANNFLVGGFFKGNYDTKFDYDEYYRKKAVAERRKREEKIANSSIELDIEFPEETFKLDSDGCFQVGIKIINSGDRDVSQMQVKAEFDTENIIDNSQKIFYLPSGYYKMLNLNLEYKGNLNKKEKVKLKVVCLSENKRLIEESTKIKLIPYSK